ncbi:oligopeptide/dipeptide ABC transporter ATP-binding protein [Actinomadura luteofluorescens]|uniref:Oligopeptide/dipeptide ABC transporter ATP-binding protein n=1 Tax=Actinomadura luteofluorescens TaxID=46163 RepID=A0A7Y9EC32_9ACTN|nr:oligopeptide/dipeptide ABC transporter ATP-binding protein [Actinomadura luteofluorescens]NYD44645.1 oligopeptide/dipeptide ABC transporter ATP-binding protein [Actinomadura luteofluorescens]
MVDAHDDGPLLRCTGVRKTFRLGTGGAGGRGGGRELRAVDGVDLDVHRGETVGLVGESGCGKSTLARCIAGLHALDGGRVEFDGRDVAQLGLRRNRALRRDIQVIFQDPYSSLNPRRRVGAIIGDPFAVHGIGTRRQRRSRVQDLMDRVGLNPEHYNRFPADFSGGQRQRIGIARALALRPRLIVCDEPVSALDVSVQAQVLNLLVDLQEEFGLTYLFISHDLSVVRHVSDRVAVMYLGRIVESAPAESCFTAGRHPYTRALVSAIPMADPDVADRRERVTLTGDLPSPASPPAGCRFHPRCPSAREDCATVEPRPQDAGPPGHRVACRYPLDVDATVSPATVTGGGR